MSKLPVGAGFFDTTMGINNFGGFLRADLGFRPFEGGKAFAFGEACTSGEFSAGAGFQVDF